MRSTVLMKEAGATLPEDGVPVTRTLSVFRVRYARCMRTPLLALCLHGYNIRYPSSRLALHGRSIEPRADSTPCALNIESRIHIRVHELKAIARAAPRSSNRRGVVSIIKVQIN